MAGDARDSGSGGAVVQPSATTLSLQPESNHSTSKPSSTHTNDTNRHHSRGRANGRRPMIAYTTASSFKPLGYAAELKDLCTALHDKIVEGFLAEEVQDPLLREVQRQTRTSLRVIREALNKYTLNELAFAYNGGKDCVVVLILYLVALHDHCIEPWRKEMAASDEGLPRLPRSLKSVYIQPPDPFPEVDEFVRDTAIDFHLDLVSSTRPMKDAFGEYLERDSVVKAIFVGTRRTDPHGAELTHFDRTNHGWPDFMRIHPVIDWSYGQIWAFIRHLDVPYCSLYDEGYTSLGGLADTLPNPALLVKNGKEEGGKQEQAQYRPAYELEDGREERLGRDR